MHAVVVAVIFGSYLALMTLIFWCVAGQLHGDRDDDDDDTVAVVDSTPPARHSTG